MLHSHWVRSPEKQGVSRNHGEEGLGLGILVRDGSAAVDGELVHDDQIGSTAYGVVAPLLAITVAEGGKETGEDHDDIGKDGNEHAGTVEAGKETKIGQKEGSSQRPLEGLSVY